VNVEDGRVCGQIDGQLRLGADAERSQQTRIIISLAYRVNTCGILMRLGTYAVPESKVVS
jgi:hypothetical protein